MDSDAHVATARLILRLYRTDDLDRLTAIYSQPDVARYLLEEPWTPQFGKAQLERRLSRVGLAEPEGALGLVIEHNGVLIGTVSLWRTEQDRRTVELGWTLDPAYGGRGFATEAVEAGLRLAFAHHDVHRVTAQTEGVNPVGSVIRFVR